MTDPAGRRSPTRLVDNGDGTYELTLLPLVPGVHRLIVNILNRPIRGSPFHLNVRSRERPRWCLTEG
ncbi:unnamed protein product [Protopolystoma xenopodis]|uniref:Uncharacterized protein n=1 Tax=Protopolystoma xenopodis TaxID=117903 RepID=A0A3S5AW39_9PLAT|nr:unnamed protein product [Protopolystoma xenopodis]